MRAVSIDSQMGSVPLGRSPFAFVDLELTGLDLERDEPVEIGVVLITGQQEEGRYHRLICPTVQSTPEAEAVHGLTSEALRQAPRFSEVAEEVSALLKGRILVAHGVSTDSAFLEKMLGGRPWSGEIDTLSLSRTLLATPDNSLQGVCGQLGLSQKGTWHRAMDDVESTLTLFSTLVAMLPHGWNCTVEGLGQVVAAHDTRSPERRRMRREMERCSTDKIPVDIHYITEIDGVLSLKLRRVSVWQVGARKYHGYCHMRNAPRTFRWRRTHQLAEGEGEFVSQGEG